MRKSMRKFGLWLWILPALVSSLTGAAAANLQIQLWDGPTLMGQWNPLIISTGTGYKVNDIGYNPSGASIFCHDMTLDYDPFLSASVDVANLTGTVQTYTLIFTLPISPSITGGTRMGGSTQGGLTDANNDGIGTLSTTGPGHSLYNGQIDGSDVLPLFPHLMTMNVPFAGGSTSASTSAGLPGPTIPGPNALSSIGIKHEFTLTAGDRATFTSFFSVQAVPEPTSLSLLALGAVVLFARRRR